MEFKKSVPWGRGEFKFRIVRSVLAFSNVRDGGAIIIGVKEIDDGFELTGIKKHHLDSYDEDEIRAKVATYADPYARCRLEVHRDDADNQYAVIDIEQFDTVPVICAQDGPCNLYEGVIYTRTRRIPESAPVPSQTEMREILDMATEAQLRRHYERQQRIGARPSGPSDAERFAEELRNLHA